MPSFDLVSAMDMGEFKNAINMAQKQINGRYDFKGSKCTVDLQKENELLITGDTEYQVKTALSILYENMGKRGLEIKGLEPSDISPTGHQQYKINVAVHTGIDKEKGKVINKIIKDSKLKISSQYLDEKVRITGKKIDDLQEIYKTLRAHKDVAIPLAMKNMK